jgi:hypothetical protein
MCYAYGKDFQCSRQATCQYTVPTWLPELHGAGTAHVPPLGSCVPSFTSRPGCIVCLWATTSVPHRTFPPECIKCSAEVTILSWASVSLSTQMKKHCSFPPSCAVDTKWFSFLGLWNWHIGKEEGSMGLGASQILRQNSESTESLKSGITSQWLDFLLTEMVNDYGPVEWDDKRTKIFSGLVVSDPTTTSLVQYSQPLLSKHSLVENKQTNKQ